MQRIGRYEVLEEIGRGGTGVVLRARDPEQLREVAIKLLLSSSPTRTKRFHTESRVLRRLQHPNLVGVLDAGEHQNYLYVVLELVRGTSLRDILETEGPFEARRAARIALGLAEGLDHAHRQGVLHRDIKPDNVLLTPAGIPRLTDFGLAKDLDAPLSGSAATVEGGFLGTPGFLPPEQAAGDLDRIGPRSDVYGLGATIYAMLTGEPPYTGETLVQVVSAMDRPPRPPSSQEGPVDEPLEDLCMRCLEKDPQDRCPSARQLADDLEAYLQGTLSPGRKAPRRGMLALAAALLLTLTAIAIVAGRLGDPEREGAAGVDARVPEPTPAAAVSPPQPPPDAAEEPGRRDWPEAQERLAAQDWPQALKALDRLLAVQPDHVEGLVERARALVALRRPADAERDLTRALALQPSAPVFWKRARVRIVQRRREEALGDLIEALALAPDDANLWFQRGLLHVDLGEMKQGAAAYGEALRCDPSYVAAHLNRGIARERLGNLKGAVADLRQVIERVPDAAQAWGALGLVLSRLKDTKGARRALDEAVRLQPSSPEFHFNRALLRMDDDPQGALRDLDEVVRLAPRHAKGHFQRGSLKEDANDPEGALRDYTRAIALDPRHVSAYYNRGLLREHRGDHQGALADYGKAIEIEPGNAATLVNRGSVRRRTGDLQGALDDFTAAIQADPEYANGWIGRAQARAAKKDWKGATADFDRAIQLSPRHPQLSYNRALCRMRSGDIPGAIADAERTLTLVPPDHRLVSKCEKLLKDMRGGLRKP